MSAVRMCDSCGNLFSVNEKNWKTFQERIPQEEGNAHNQGFREVDMGPCCMPTVGTVMPVLRPRTDDIRDVKVIEAAKDEPKDHRED